MKRAALILLTLSFSTPVWAMSVTANSTLKRGTLISASDISIDGAKAEHRSDILETYVGKEMSRTVYNGTPLRESDIQEPVLVHRNSRVNMIYRIGGLEIRAVGRAMSEGAKGDFVTVMNVDSRQKVDGIVISSGTVEMTP